MGDEMQSIELFEELCGVCRGQGNLQDAPQQLADLAELMHSYGLPTPGWGQDRGPGRPETQATAASDLEQVRPRAGAKAYCTLLSYVLVCWHVQGTAVLASSAGEFKHLYGCDLSAQKADPLSTTGVIRSKLLLEQGGN